MGAKSTSETLSIAISDLLDDPAVGGQPTDLLVDALRVTAACVRSGTATVRRDRIAFMIRRPALDTVFCDRLVSIGVIQFTETHLTLTRPWLQKVLSPAQCRQLVKNDETTTIPPTPIQHRLLDTDDGLVIRCSKGPRDLVGNEVLRFNKFWDAFANKQGRNDAVREWVLLENNEKKSPGSVDFDRIISAATKEARLRKEAIARGLTPIYAQGWLSRRRFDDEVYDQDLDRWSDKEQALIDAVGKYRMFEVWEIPTAKRREQIADALQRHPELTWWHAFLEYAVKEYDWGALRNKSTKMVPMATVLNENVIVRAREHVRVRAREHVRRKDNPLPRIISREDSAPPSAAPTAPHS